MLHDISFYNIIFLQVVKNWKLFSTVPGNFFVHSLKKENLSKIVYRVESMYIFRGPATLKGPSEILFFLAKIVDSNIFFYVKYL